MKTLQDVRAEIQEMATFGSDWDGADLGCISVASAVLAERFVLESDGKPLPKVCPGVSGKVELYWSEREPRLLLILDGNSEEVVLVSASSEETTREVISFAEAVARIKAA